MSGFLYLIAGYIYWVISSFLTRSAASAAKKKGISGWKYGLPVAIIMYHLVFWDLIPTFVTLQYNCMIEGGYWVYKTPEQWKIENPGVAKTLVDDDSVQSTSVGNEYNYTDTYYLNQRFNWVVQRSSFTQLKYLKREEQKIVDRETNEVMARYIGFNTTHDGGISWEKIKFWQVGWQYFRWKQDLGRMSEIHFKYATLGKSNE
jgi:hypothetical protein